MLRIEPMSALAGVGDFRDSNIGVDRGECVGRSQRAPTS